ncbi:hypothetical protein PCE1_000799 [Barthelona sp. PCE]
MSLSVSEAIEARYSCRNFDKQPIPEAELAEMLEIATKTCSACNQNLVHMWALNDYERAHSIGMTCTEKLPESWGSILNRPNDCPITCDAATVIFFTIDNNRAKVKGWEDVDLGQLMMQLQLLATAKGYGTLNVGLFDFVKEEIMEMIGNPEGHTYRMALAIGKPTEVAEKSAINYHTEKRIHML